MDFGLLALIMAAAVLSPLLASLHRFSPPVVVGEVLLGLAIGPSGLAWADPHDRGLEVLAAIGFALLMFILGTHLPLRDAALRSALLTGAGLAATVGALACALAFAMAPGVGLHRPWILTILIATSSGAVALPMLQSIGRSDATVVRLTAWIAIADVATVLAIPLVMATGAIGRVLTGGLLVTAAAVVVFVVARLVRGRAVITGLRQRSVELGWGLDLRVSLAVLFALAWLATRFGSSILIAGFAGGAIVALLGEPRRVAVQLIGIGEGFLVPMFFIHLGTTLEVGAMFRSRTNLALAAAVAAAAVTVHVVAAIVWHLPPAGGLLASAQLGVPAAVVSIGTTSHQLQPGQASAIMSSVVITLLVCAVGGETIGRPTR